MYTNTFVIKDSTKKIKTIDEKKKLKYRKFTHRTNTHKYRNFNKARLI